MELKSHMSASEITLLPLSEKIQLMETLWEDLRSRVNTLAVTKEHQEMLDKRRARVDTGEACLQDWDMVKHTLGGR